MTVKILLKANDLPKITGFNGNIDIDAINPSINIAQNTHIKRILGDKLYQKIVLDYTNSTLSGNYKIIYEDYVIYMLAFFTASIYLSLSTNKTANNGTYKVNIEGSSNTGMSEVNTLGKNYEAIAISFENSFNSFLKTIEIPEVVGMCSKSSTNLIQWY